MHADGEVASQAETLVLSSAAHVEREEFRTDSEDTRHVTAEPESRPRAEATFPDATNHSPVDLVEPTSLDSWLVSDTPVIDHVQPNTTSTEKARIEGHLHASCRELQGLLQELSEAEARWGEDHACVAQCLRRLCRYLEGAGFSSQIVPLLIRIAEIEQRELGQQHPDVLSTRARIKETLASEATMPDWAEAMETHHEERQRALGSVSQVPEQVPEQGGMSENLGAVAGVVGSAVIGAALHFGVSTLTSTGSMAAGLTGRAMSFAAERTFSAEPTSWTSFLFSSAGHAAWSTTQTVASSTFGAAQYFGMSLASSATSSAVSHAVSGTARLASSLDGANKSSHTSEAVSPDT